MDPLKYMLDPETEDRQNTGSGTTGNVVSMKKNNRI